MTTIDKIRAEIERLMHQASDMNQYGLLTKEQEVCILSQMSRLLSFLDTLQEQEPQGLDEAAEKYRPSWKPSEDLDAEVKRFFDECIVVHDAKIYGGITEKVIEVSNYELTARHFAKWASEHCVKPAEWSEEDEEMIGNIISSLRGYTYYIRQNGNYNNHEAYIQKQIEFLNSLRPTGITEVKLTTWKPSEEQMRIIQMVLTDEAMDDNVHSVLESLYNDLKKLK